MASSQTSAPCKHTVVRIVSRTADAEFVECQSCGEIFDSIEYEDMAREEEGAADTELDLTPKLKPKSKAGFKP